MRTSSDWSPVRAAATDCSSMVAIAMVAMMAMAGCSGDVASGSSKAAPQTGLPDLPQLEDVAAADIEDLAPLDAGPDGANPAEVDAAAKPNCPGGPGCDCKQNADCDMSICLDTPTGQQCAQSCVEVCPTDFKCATVSAGGGDAVTICVPKQGRLCNPCAASKDCEALGILKPACVDQGALGAFCGIDCSTTADCPTGYNCSDVKAIEGQPARQCVRSSDEGAPGLPGICPCSALAVSQKLSTICSVETKDAEGKVVGSCKGQRTCLASGLSACAAPPASVEVCNGLDDNCNGATDEASCDDQNPCTVDTCDPTSGTAQGCSHAITAAPCDADASLCTEGDKCQDGKCLPGPAKKCDDGNLCTLDNCSPKSGCVKTPDDGAPCDDENPCTQGDACKSGACAQGTAKPCESGDTCVDGKCSMVDGKCKFTNKVDDLPCNDGTECTKSDVCKAGQCLGLVASCDDGNPCTDDGCDATNGCSHKDNNLPCSDANACTVGDACTGGACKPGSGKACDDGNPCTADSCNGQTGICAMNPVVQGCTDNDACTQGDACQGGVCQAGAAKACDDQNPCTTDSCDQATGSCLHANSVASCEDGDPCSIGDLCVSGACKPGSAKVCADADTCTADICDAKTGQCKFNQIVGCGGNCAADGDCDDNNACTGNSCQNGKCAFPPSVGPCDDGKSCTVGDLCGGGTCKSGAVKSCDDGNPCTDDTCDGASGKCANVVNTGSCTDNDACTGPDACADGKCKPGAAKTCNDGNPCTEDGCDGTTGNCVAVATAKACDDGNACTVGDTCLGGKCLAGVAKACDDANPCTNDGCDVATGACFNKANAVSCDDQNACTQGDICTLGACKSGAAKVCDDKNPCTDDACDTASGACTAVANTAACTDNNACTAGDVCNAAACQPGAAKVCNDGDACTADSCLTGSGLCLASAIIGCGGNCAKVADCDDQNACTDNQCSAGKCQFVPNALACSDGNGCTLSDVCSAGACKPGAAKNCDDKNPCTADTCASQTGACQNPAAAGPCDDGNLCTTADACDASACKAGKLVICDDNQPCTTDSCDPGSGKCNFAANTAPCSDGDACTLNDACAAGACKSGAAKNCDDGKPCTNDACDPSLGTCKSIANTDPCSDNNACTGGDLCVASACKPGATKNCDDGNPCTSDSCDTATGTCGHAATTASCTDGNPCTLSDACSNSACKPGAAKVCNDGNACTTDSCDPGTGACVSSPIIGCGGNCAQASDCKDGNPCTDDTCVTGKCAFPANTQSCSDGNACTDIDVCKGGTCSSGAVKSCDDANTCTTDACSVSTGCTNLDKAGACEDGSACTVGDACLAAKCVSGAAKNCDDGSPCTIDACDAAKGCTYNFIAGIYKDCAAVADQKVGGDGVYCIDPDGAGGLAPAQTVCDITGGGWTLMIHRAKYTDSECKLHTAAAIGLLTGTQAATDAKLADGLITAFAKPVYRFDGGYSAAPISQYWQIQATWTSLWSSGQNYRCTTDAADWPTAWSTSSNPSGYPLGNTTCKGAKYSTIWWHGGLSACAYIGDPAGWEWRNHPGSGNAPSVINYWVKSGTCKADADCNDKNACTDDACSAATATCSYAFNAGNTAKCDDGNACTTDSCDAIAGACKNLAIAQCCGNGVKEGAEQCDAGAKNGTAPDACRPTCKLAGCGDTILDTGEACDDGNKTNGDGCFSYCQKEPPCPTVQTCIAGAANVVVLKSSKAEQSFVVPAGVTCIGVKAWGGAGGFGGSGGGGWSREGGPGGGGFSGATGSQGLVVTPGETLTVIAGGTGGKGLGWCAANGAGAGGWGGARSGGAGSSPTSCGWDSSGGGGGGASYLARGSDVLIIAGGGGGGGGGGGNGYSWAGKGAGGGGNLSGGLGKCGILSNGSCAAHVAGVSQATANGIGTAGKSGPDNLSAGPGGGGGGWLGGWGGSYDPSTGAFGGAGGGAGKSCGPDLVSGNPGTESDDIGTTPAAGAHGNASDADFAADAGNGRVVIRW